MRNGGNVDATGVSSTLLGGAGVCGHAGQLGLPDDRGRRRAGRQHTAFGIHLANAAACGADAAATLAITTGSETQTVPLVLPTGAPGSLQSYSTASPVAIPDDNAAGVTSSVFVPDRGRIKDAQREPSPGSRTRS